ncbi:MAG: hypothetical protein RL303_1081, partial [Verrucomicrobiota bacterium]
MVSDNKPTSFPNSTRIFVPGSRPDILVPMREVKLADTSRPDGAKSANEPVRIYDTSGPWGDPAFHGDVEKGLPPIRAAWIAERGDVEAVAGRELKPEDDGYLSWKHAETAQRA